MIRFLTAGSLLVFCFFPFCLLAGDKTPWDQAKMPVPLPVESYGIHFQPHGFKPVPGKRLRVLVLGTGAGKTETYEAWKKYSHPETGEPYDLVIGAAVQREDGTISKLREGKRVWFGDRFLQGSTGEAQTGKALTEAILGSFGGPLELESLDVHSNGAPVGVTALKLGAFLAPKRVNVMGPDPGIHGELLLDRTLLKLMHKTKAGGVSVFISERDPVPVSAGIEQRLFEMVLQGTSLAREMVLFLKVRSPNQSVTAGDIKRIKFPLPPDSSVMAVAPHYLEHYILRRAIATGDVGIIFKVVRRMGGNIPNDLFAMLMPQEKALLADAHKKWQEHREYLVAQGTRSGKGNRGRADPVLPDSTIWAQVAAEKQALLGRSVQNERAAVTVRLAKKRQADMKRLAEEKARKAKEEKLKKDEELKQQQQSQSHDDNNSSYDPVPIKEPDPEVVRKKGDRIDKTVKPF